MLITPNVSGIVGCTYPLASNYDAFATVEDGSCEYDTTTSGCPTDVDGDGATGTQDLLLFLGAFGQTCLD